MRSLAPWLIAGAILALIIVVAITREQRAADVSAQGELGSAVPSLVATIVEQPIVVPTFAPGQPTTDFRLPADASRDAPGVPALERGDPDSTGYTEEDVRRYLSQAPHMFSRSLETVPEIVSISEMTSLEAANAIRDTVARPDEAPVILVELRGDFAASGPQGYVVTGQASFMVFDATTGNLLKVTLDDANRLK